jgi:hypothetical protein
MYQQTITTGGSTAVFNTFSSQPQPTAHITKGRGRLKTYGQAVYLKDSSHFEIELHNPKTTPVLAKIWINGKLLSNAGIIVKPGQRVYLERFMDVAKKFKFETYDVDTSTGTVRAIADNGKVEVVFYDEASYQLNGNSGTNIWQQPYPTFTSQPWQNHTLTSNIGGSANAFYCASSLGPQGSNGPQGPAGIPVSMETGRIEKGESSNQEFEYTDGQYNSWSCTTVRWQILPESKKPVEMGEIRSYCTGCGTRHKKSSWKFCPNCGTSITE